MVPVHSPLTIFGRNVRFLLRCARELQGMNGAVRQHGAEFEREVGGPQISCTAVTRTAVQTWPPYSGSVPSCAIRRQRIVGTHRGIRAPRRHPPGPTRALLVTGTWLIGSSTVSANRPASPRMDSGHITRVIGQTRVLRQPLCLPAVFQQQNAVPAAERDTWSIPSSPWPINARRLVYRAGCRAECYLTRR